MLHRGGGGGRRDRAVGRAVGQVVAAGTGRAGRAARGADTAEATCSGQETERLQQALVGLWARLRARGRAAFVAQPGGRVVQRRTLAPLRVRGDQRGVVGLDPVRALDGTAGAADALGQLIANPAAATFQRGRVVVLAVLLAIIFVLTEHAGAAAEVLARLFYPVRYSVQWRAGDDQDAEPGHQGQHRRGDVRGQRLGQRGGDDEADQAARVPHGHLTVGRSGCAVGDVQQPEHPDGQRAPADSHPPGLSVVLRVAKVAPGQHPGQQRRQPCGGPGGAVHEGGDRVADQVVHAPPDTGGQHERDGQPEQPNPVPAVVGIQVAGAAPDPPGGEADGIGRHHPSGSDCVADPADQDQDRVPGPGGSRATAAGPAAPGRRAAGPAVAFAVGPGLRLGRAAGRGRASRGRRRLSAGRAGRLRTEVVGTPAARAGGTLGRTGGHNDHGNKEGGP